MPHRASLSHLDEPGAGGRWIGEKGPLPRKSCLLDRRVEADGPPVRSKKSPHGHGCDPAVFIPLQRVLCGENSPTVLVEPLPVVPANAVAKFDLQMTELFVFGDEEVDLLSPFRVR